MYFAVRWQDKATSKRPLLAVALLLAAGGTLAAATTSPALAPVFLSVAAMGFKSASPLFWTIPQSGLHPGCSLSPQPPRSPLVWCASLKERRADSEVSARHAAEEMSPEVRASA